MSHIVSIATRIKDAESLAAACRRLGLPPPESGTAQLFGATAAGQLVRLPGWTYPAVVDTLSGEVHYDNYNGRWGEQAHLDRLLQAYAIERTRLEARLAGHTLVEQPLPDGSVKLTIRVVGGGGGGNGGAR